MKISLRLPNFLQAKKQGLSRRRSGSFMCPVREWGLGLLISSLLFLVLGGHAGYNFYTQSNEFGVLPEQDEPVVTYREGSVMRALEVYEEREAEFIRLRNGRKVQVQSLPQQSLAEPKDNTSLAEVLESE